MKDNYGRVRGRACRLAFHAASKQLCFRTELDPGQRAAEMPTENPVSAPPKGPSVWNTEQTERALKAARLARWSWNVDNNRFGMDERGFRLWQLTPTDGVTFEDLSSRIHPADRYIRRLRASRSQ
jgi:hypothetical protein